MSPRRQVSGPRTREAIDEARRLLVEQLKEAMHPCDRMDINDELEELLKRIK
jgi:hypothetical protein